MTGDATPAAATPDPAKGAGVPAGADLFRHHYSPEFPALLDRLNASLLVTTYQAGKLVVFRSDGTRVSTLLRSFEQPMGLSADSGRLVLGTRNAVWTFRNAPDIAAQLDPPGRHDACYVPRTGHVTGDVRGHELEWSADGELWLVNTRFSCLCTLHPDYSFVPRWRPPFVSALAAEDRCHLNGLAIGENGRPGLVTALGESDTKEGWRAAKASGGILIDVASGEIVSRGLSMPHSPRLAGGRAWVLDSGRGELQAVDIPSGKRDAVARLPGYTRGLAICEGVAFVGLSKIREKREFGGLPIGRAPGELRCGVWAVDLRTGQTAGFVEFVAGCEELFAVQVVRGVRWPAVVGFQKDTLNGIFVVPPATPREASQSGRLPTTAAKHEPV